MFTLLYYKIQTILRGRQNECSLEIIEESDLLGGISSVHEGQNNQIFEEHNTNMVTEQLMFSSNSDGNILNESGFKFFYHELDDDLYPISVRQMFYRRR